MPPAYLLARMLPSTATPRVAPSSRSTSFMADPTPAFSFGSEPMIASVAGVIATARPKPMTTSAVATRP
jgi:hypothetical protein